MESTNNESLVGDTDTSKIPDYIFSTEEFIRQNVNQATFHIMQAVKTCEGLLAKGLNPEKCVWNISDGYYKIGELYDNVLALLITVCNLHKEKSWKYNPNISTDSGSLNANEFIVGIITSKGTVSFRVDKQFFDYFKIPEKYELYSFCDSDVFKLLSLASEQEGVSKNSDKAYSYSDCKSLTLFSRSFNGEITSSPDLNSYIGFAQKLIEFINFDYSICVNAHFTPKFSVGDVSDGYNKIGVLYDLIASGFLVVGKTLAAQSAGKDEENKKLKYAWKFNGPREGENIPALYKDYFTVGLETAGGVISYPIQNKYWDNFNVEELPKIPADDYSKRKNLLSILSLTLSEEEINQIIDSGLLNIEKAIQK